MPEKQRRLSRRSAILSAPSRLMSDFSNEDLITVQTNMTDSPHVSVVKLYITFGFLESCLKKKTLLSVCYFCSLFVWNVLLSSKISPSFKPWRKMLWTHQEFREFGIFWSVCASWCLFYAGNWGWLLSWRSVKRPNYNFIVPFAF